MRPVALLLERRAHTVNVAVRGRVCAMTIYSHMDEHAGLYTFYSRANSVQ